ncbi:SDR family oxidoreductase [Microaerobacter geothermalis]|uniref:SDR family oxidoreductase n=1 Tax=Microaerobacter geothermalis TaxID=674972 RepID=UPI001F4356BE|nr:SDR family oxidoreductase [Microaerobacter geothermalis]MCF6094941.1 SDR family oxidoreductase [Microaerobacter geothermalis]
MKRDNMKGKVIIITGASSGIGRATAVSLAKEGCILVLAARRTEELYNTLQLVKENGGTGITVPTDVRDENDVRQMIEKTIQQFERLDVLINNAGFGKFAMLSDTELQDFEEMMNVNYMGTVRCTKHALPYLLKQRSGHIINVASIAGKVGTAKSTGYSATKHAVLGFTSSLRQELSGTGIHVSAVNPGPIDTPFFSISDPEGTYKNRIKPFLIKPEAVAKKIVRLIKFPKREVNIPVPMAIGAILYQLAPGFFEKIAGNIINKK